MKTGQTTLEQAKLMLIVLERQTALQWLMQSSLSRHSHSYRRATKTGQATLEQAKTVLLMSQILSLATKARLRVDFLVTANRSTH